MKTAGRARWLILVFAVLLANNLAYVLLGFASIPLYYERDPKEISHRWLGRVKDSMKTIVPRFSTRRMLKEYVEQLYVTAVR